MKKLVLLAFCLSFAFAFRYDYFDYMSLDKDLKNKIMSIGDALQDLQFFYAAVCKEGIQSSCYKKNMLGSMKYIFDIDDQSYALQQLCDKGYDKACNTIKTGRYEFKIIEDKDCKGKNCDKKFDDIRSANDEECGDDDLECGEKKIFDIFLSKTLNEYKNIYTELNNTCKAKNDDSCVMAYLLLNEPVLGIKDDSFDSKKILNDFCKNHKNPVACAEYAKKFISDEKERDEIYKNSCQTGQRAFADPEICYELALKSSGDEKVEYMHWACGKKHKTACAFIADNSAKNGDTKGEFANSLFACSLNSYKYCYKAGKFLKYDKNNMKDYKSKKDALFSARKYLTMACLENMKEACDELKDLENLEEIIEDCKAKKQDACDKLKYLINL